MQHVRYIDAARSVYTTDCRESLNSCTECSGRSG